MPVNVYVYTSGVSNPQEMHTHPFLIKTICFSLFNLFLSFSFSFPSNPLEKHSY